MLMDRAIPDGEVTGYEALIQGLSLPDADDRHVLAAVICAAQRQRHQLKTPPLCVDDYLDILFRQGLVQTVKALLAYRPML
ncbi:hypothetical protein [Pseudomonas sp. MWU12-2323]